MTTSSVTQHVSIADSTNLKSPQNKKRRLDTHSKKEGLFLEESPYTAQDQARIVFFEKLFFECLFCWPKEPIKKLCIIIPKLQDNKTKIGVKLFYNAVFKIQFPNYKRLFRWIDAPEELILKSYHFRAIMEIVHSISVKCIFLLKFGNTFIGPKQHVETFSRQIQKKIHIDQVIFFDKEASLLGKKTFECFQKNNPNKPCYYVTSFFDLSIKRITSCSLVYFFENQGVQLQSEKVLMEKGFRVVHSLR